MLNNICPQCKEGPVPARVVRTDVYNRTFIVTCVGSLRKGVLRPVNQQEPLVREQKFEIVSLVGTFSSDGSHLHIALSDGTGASIGGHLLEGNLIYTTAEIVVGEAEGLVFRREVDAETGFRELRVLG